MNKKTMLLLAKFSDDLDRKGLLKLADRLDEIIESQGTPEPHEAAGEPLTMLEIDVEIPQEEKEMLLNVLDSLERSLK